MSNQLSLKTSNTILYCRRWPETVDFYRRQMQFPVSFESDWFVEFELTPTSRLSVADERRATIKSSGGAGLTLTFQVADANEMWQELKGRGLELGPLKDHAWGARVFYFFDPEGHRLEVWSEK